MSLSSINKELVCKACFVSLSLCVCVVPFVLPSSMENKPASKWQIWNPPCYSPPPPGTKGGHSTFQNVERGEEKRPSMPPFSSPSKERCGNRHTFLVRHAKRRRHCGPTLTCRTKHVARWTRERDSWVGTDRVVAVDRPSSSTNEVRSTGTYHHETSFSCRDLVDPNV